jgi:hypothetical protein
MNGDAGGLGGDFWPTGGFGLKGSVTIGCEVEEMQESRPVAANKMRRSFVMSE